MERIITGELLNSFKNQLQADEKSTHTIEKYLRDVRKFCSFAEKNKAITKELVIAYKEYLRENYALSSANSMLAALNSFFMWVGWVDCMVKPFKEQKDSFRSEEKELSFSEYIRLLETAKKQKQIWLYLVMVTLASTGIRISELKYITVNSLCTRRARVFNKGKSRTVVLPSDLCKKLRVYIREKNITSGSIFVTRNGNPIDRSNIHHAMKRLCKKAGVNKNKVFPHNLRHLFAVRHYSENHDLTGLASILGHSNINTTRIYTMETIEAKAEEINALGLVV
jgi:site-specific recombinase XerD